jgi:DNA-binding NarL/FixJ family response regulator
MEIDNLHIAIVEDKKAEIQSLYLRLRSLKDKYKAVVVFNNLAQVLNYSKCLNKYIIIVDLNANTSEIIKCIYQLKINWPNCSILVMSDFNEGDDALKLIIAGASGYIKSHISTEKVEEAIQEIANGGAPVTPMVARKLVQYFQTCKSKTNQLTKRELEVTKCLVNGMSYKLIAADLNVSIDTIRKNITSIYNKLNVNGKGELFTLYRDVINY